MRNRTHTCSLTRCTRSRKTHYATLRLKSCSWRWMSCPGDQGRICCGSWGCSHGRSCLGWSDVVRSVGGSRLLMSCPTSEFERALWFMRGLWCVLCLMLACAWRFHSVGTIVRSRMFALTLSARIPLFANITLIAHCANNVILANNDFLLVK